MSIDPNVWASVRWFAPHEFLGWADRMEPALLLLLDRLRGQHGKVWRILDAGRDTSDNDQSEHLPHPVTGLIRAADVRPDGGRIAAYEAWLLAHLQGVPGLGAYDGHEGNGRPFIHLDVGQGDRRPRPARWIRSGGAYTTWNEDTGGWPTSIDLVVADLMGLSSSEASLARAQVLTLIEAGGGGFNVGLIVAVAVVLVALLNRPGR